jgi:hypothetical protein
MDLGPAPATVPSTPSNWLPSARYIIDGNRNYLWAHTRVGGKPIGPRCAQGILREDEDCGYSLTGDSIAFLRFDNVHGHRTAAGRVVRDTLEVRRGTRLERYVRIGGAHPAGAVVPYESTDDFGRKSRPT